MNIYETPGYNLEQTMYEIDNAVEKTTRAYNFLVGAIKAGARKYDEADFLMTAGKALRNAMDWLLDAMNSVAPVYQEILKEKGTGEGNEET